MLYDKILKDLMNISKKLDFNLIKFDLNISDYKNINKYHFKSNIGEILNNSIKKNYGYLAQTSIESIYEIIKIELKELEYYEDINVFGNEIQFKINNNYIKENLKINNINNINNINVIIYNKNKNILRHKILSKFLLFNNDNEIIFDNKNDIINFLNKNKLKEIHIIHDIDYLYEIYLLKKEFNFYNYEIGKIYNFKEFPKINNYFIQSNLIYNYNFNLNFSKLNNNENDFNDISKVNNISFELNILNNQIKREFIYTKNKELIKNYFYNKYILE